MTGRKTRTHDHVVMHLGGEDDASDRIIYNDPRRFGFMLFAEPGKLNMHPLIKDLGTEPTGNRLDGALLAKLFA